MTSQSLKSQIQCIHLQDERTTGKGFLRHGTIEDFPVSNMHDTHHTFGFAFMRSVGKSGARIIAAFTVQDGVRVVFDKNPGPDTSIIIKVYKKEP